MTPTPRFGKTPLEILSNDEELDDSLAYKYGIRFAFGLLGCGYPFFRNFGQRRPVLAGLQQYVLWGVGGVIFGHFLEQYRANYLAERDAVLRHYVQLHPEDFPPPTRKKYGELLEEWIPIR